MAPKPIAAQLAASDSVRMDAYISALSSLNTSGDKRTRFKYQPDAILTPEMADQLYNGNDLAARVCDIYPEEALAEGVRVVVTTPDGAADSEDDATATDAEIMDRLAELCAVDVVTETAIFSDVHGDAFIYVGVDDGAATQAEPLDPKRVKSVLFLKTAERTQLSTATRYNDPTKPNFGRIETYNLIADNGMSVIVHESRFIKMWGARTSSRALKANSWWHYSKLQRVQSVLRDFAITWDSAALLVQNASQGVFKLENFLQLLASKGGAAAMAKRAELIDITRGAANSIVLDKNEEFSYEGIALTGVPDMMDRFAARLSTAVNIPVSKLTGVAAGGLNATGEGDRRNWQAQLRAYSRSKLKPAFMAIVDLLRVELGIAEDTKIEIEFCPLEQPSDLDAAKLRYQQAQTDALYVVNSVLTPEEVAIARFGPGGYSTDTEIDLEIRKTIVDTMTAEDLKNDPTDDQSGSAAAPGDPADPKAGKPNAPANAGAKSRGVSNGAASRKPRVPSARAGRA